MKNFKKMITSAIAGLMAAAALATTAGAAEYVNNDGFYWNDGINDGRVFVEDSYGNYFDIGDYYTYSSYNDYYYDYYGCNYTYLYDEVYIGHDAYFGNVYYRADVGYYTSTRYLGSSFSFTEYIGRDQYGRDIYYRSELGYIYLKGSTWYTLGYNLNYTRSYAKY